MKADQPASQPSQDITKITSPVQPSQDKNPMTVSFYTHGKPEKPYVVVGKEVVSKFNTAGVKRQRASIHDAMRTLAAAMGGDAVINITHDTNTVRGEVVAYPKVLV